MPNDPFPALGMDNEIPVPIDSLVFNKRDIIQFIGYREEKEADHFSKIIDQVILKVKDLIEIKAGYKVLPFKAKKNGIYLGNVFFETESIIAGQLKKSEKGALFLATIGNGPENWSKEEYKKGDPLGSYLTDITATVITEALGDYLHQFIQKKMKSRGLKVTNRFSPGYCNWKVSEQQKLFSLFPQNFCGVLLLESSLMVPEKSISGVIGIGSKVEWKAYLCDKCNKTDCLYKMKHNSYKN